MDQVSSSHGQRVRDQGSRDLRATAEGGWLDAEVRDSFPASDPLSHWAGPVRAISEADRAHQVAGLATTEEPRER